MSRPFYINGQTRLVYYRRAFFFDTEAARSPLLLYFIDII
jgi:hypothetical protein